MFTIAAHNLSQGGPRTYTAWARVLNAFDPDILLLQESSAPSYYVKTLFGLVNCWQALKPNMTLPQTLRHQFREDSPCFHLDGLFVPATWLRHLEDCQVFNGPEWRGEGCSDHFPVVATFAA